MTTNNISVISEELELEIKSFIGENPSWGNRRLAKKFGITKNVAQHRVQKYRTGTRVRRNGTSRMATKPVLRGSICATDFIEEYDVPKKIRDALHLLENRVISDANFRASLGVDGASWSRARELDEFQPYQKKVRAKFYWTTPETFAALQGNSG